jgi:Virulence factor
LTRVQVLHWQEIPSLVKTTGDDGFEVRRQLPEWFQQEIDRVAMDQGLIGSDAYLEAWEWRELEPRDGNAAEVADAVEAELIAQHAPSGR